MLSLFGAALAGLGRGFTYALADDTVVSTSPDGELSDLVYSLNTDGTITETIDLAIGGTQVNTSTVSPWSDRLGEDGTLHHARIASNDSGTNRYTGTPTMTTWTALTSDIDFDFVGVTTTGPDSDTSTYTLELSDDGGSTVLDSMTLTVQLDVASP